MLLETAKTFSDFELLDTGDGYRLERWGGVLLQRPDPQIIWQKSLPGSEWEKAAAIFKPGSEEDKGRWEIHGNVPNSWIISFQGIKFQLKLSPFKHTGIFAEQAAQWEWMKERIEDEEFGMQKGGQQILNPKSKILNLFAYTGGATMVLAKAGCQVTHVDASKPSLNWANENHALNNLPKESVRWMLDDAVKFVQREVKRGNRYDAIIMDPPAFGHGPTGKTWKFNRDLPNLLKDCVQLLSDSPRFLIINGYATNSSALSLKNVLEDAMGKRGGTTEFGELCLNQRSNRMISTGIFARWRAT